MSDEEKIYAPRNALVLMKPEHAEVGKELCAQLVNYRVFSHMETDDLSSVVLLGIGKYDMLITGPGYDHLIDAVTSDPTKRGVFTVAASTNGARPDMKVNTHIDLFHEAAQGRIVDAYMQHEGVQQFRSDEDMADLEITVMNATSEGKQETLVPDPIVLY